MTSKNHQPAAEYIMKKELIAPCGMNCGICISYLALTYDTKQNNIKIPYCSGCRIRNKKCSFIKKKCDKILNNKINYCCECNVFPCKQLQNLDKRYRTNFKMSMIENLETIKKQGIEKFLIEQKNKWTCPKCGKTICCHNGICFNCNLKILFTKKNLYRW